MLVSLEGIWQRMNSDEHAVVLHRPVGGYVPHTTPVVGLHREVLHCLHAQVDAECITNKRIHNPLQV